MRHPHGNIDFSKLSHQAQRRPPGERSGPWHATSGFFFANDALPARRQRRSTSRAPCKPVRRQSYVRSRSARHQHIRAGLMAQMCSTTPKTIRMGTFSVMRIALAPRYACSTSPGGALFRVVFVTSSTAICHQPIKFVVSRVVFVSFRGKF